jgi:hypothetical protein
MAFLQRKAHLADARFDVFLEVSVEELEVVRMVGTFPITVGGWGVFPLVDPGDF